MPVTKEVKMTFTCDHCGQVAESYASTQRECERHVRYGGWAFNMGSLGSNPFCSCPECAEKWRNGGWTRKLEAMRKCGEGSGRMKRTAI